MLPDSGRRGPSVMQSGRSEKQGGGQPLRVAFLEPRAVVFLVQSATLPQLSERVLRGSTRRCSSHIRTAAIL